MRTLVVVATLATLSCTRARLPMTAGQLAAIGDGAGALSLYLRQDDADPGVCDGSSGRGVLPPGKTVGRQLVNALREGKVAPGVWRACAEAILRDGDAARAEDLLEWILGAATDLVSDGNVESDAGLRARLSTLQGVYAVRQAGPVAPEASRRSALRKLEEILGAVARARPGRTPGPVASSAARELAAVLRAEGGEWCGRPADRALVEATAASGDEAALEILARRLPDPALRAEAERALVALRIARSPFPEVRADTAAVLEEVLRTGTNAVALPASSASLAGDVLRGVHVQIEQDLERRSATVRRFLRAGPDAFRLSALPLRGTLTFEVSGLSRPVTICPAGRALDPTPCVAPDAVEAVTSLASVGRDGALLLAEGIPASSAVALARAGGRLEVPLALDGSVVATPSWPVAYARPASLVLEGRRSGARGPDLAVAIERVGSRLVYTVTGAGADIEAAVEWTDAPAFHIASRGAPGRDGADGSDGVDGSDGWSGTSASCPSFRASEGGAGGDGGNGGDGGSGGDGGRGGDVRVRVHAATAARADEVLAVVRATIASEGAAGGEGGEGGSGGRGGRGGRGGSGAHCSLPDGGSEWLSSGSDGRDGRDGLDGSDGRDGSAGSPGAVTFEVAVPLVAAPRIRPGGGATH